MKVVALFRVSSDRQANEGASLDAQARRFDELAARERWQVVARLRGSESATGASRDREVLQAALRAIADHEADAIYVHEQSRLTRGDELEVALLMRELHERSVTVLVNGSVCSLSSIDDRFMFRIRSVVDRAEVERFVERVMRGKSEKARQGKRVGGRLPFGYAGSKGAVRIVPEEAEVVRRVFRRFLEGEAMKPIARALKLSPKLVRYILSNPFYVGEVSSFRFRRDKRTRRIVSTPERAITAPGSHEPLVDRATWEAAQERRKAVYLHTGGANPTMLAGLLYIDGRPAKGIEGTKYGYRGGRCLDRGMVEREVWRGFTEVIQSAEFVALMMQDPGTGSAEGDPRKILAAQQAEASRIQKRLDGLARALADGDVDKLTYRRLAAEAADRLRILKTALATPKRLDPVDPLAELAAVLEIALASPPEDRGRILRRVVGRIDCEAGQARADLPRDPVTRQWVGGGVPKWGIRELVLRCHHGTPFRAGSLRAVVTACVVSDSRPCLRLSRASTAQGGVALRMGVSA